jgi:hypothetical protein
LKSSQDLEPILRDKGAAAGIQADPAEIRRALDFFCEPDAVYELRALGTSKGTVRGYFKDLDALTSNAIGCSNTIVRYSNGIVRAGLEAKGVYITLNPVVPDLLARSADEIQLYAPRGESTEDGQIVARRWLPIDVDFARPSGISTSEAEHNAANERAREIRDFLYTRGWLAPIRADPGNGAHLLYRIDLPNDDSSKELVRRVLKALNRLFGSDKIIIDESNFNAARIWKLYGTVARKGSNLPERPHRLAKIVEVPERVEIISREQLEQVAAILASQHPEFARSLIVNSGAEHGQAYERFNLDAFIAKHGIVVKDDSPYTGGRRLILQQCPFDPSHGQYTDVAIIQSPDGVLGYACQHAHCVDKHWADFRNHYEPGYRERTKPHLEGGTQAGHSGRTSNASSPNVWGETIKFSDVPCEPVEWLWQDRVAIGKENLLVGDPDNGKSWLSLDIAAHVTTGTAFIDGSPCEQGNVIIIGMEDAVSDTMRPRLEAQGGDPEFMHLLTIKCRDGEQTIDQSFSLADHLPQLRQKILDIGDVRLVIIDPLTAHLGDVDANKDSRVRAILTPLAALASELKFALLAIMHLNKAAVLDVIYRVSGSIAFVAQARSAWAVLEAPPQMLEQLYPDQVEGTKAGNEVIVDLDQLQSMRSARLFLKLKGNLTRSDAPGFAFSITNNEQGNATLVWNPMPVTVKLRDIMGGFSNAPHAPRKPRGPKPDKTEAAKAFIAAILADGRALPVSAIESAAEAAGIAQRTLNRAANSLHVTRQRGQESHAGSFWSLPADANPVTRQESPDS